MEPLISLISRSQTGDADAYGVIVSRFQDMAYGYAYTILSDFDQAQDAAQEAFIEAYRCLSTLREPMAFSAWLKRIVFKHCDRLTRQKHLESMSLDGVELACTLPGPSEIVEQREFTRHVQTAIQNLPDGQREVTTLFYINGYSHQEIADFLEVPAKTVKSRLYASRQRLKERMLDMVQEELMANALPEGFAQDTVEQAVARAAILNTERQYDEAEKLLRKVLANAPAHPAVLKELNRAIMRGRVYGRGRWDLLRELARQGQIILRTSDDEEIHRQLAQTLLAIPAMTEAISFLESWIAKKGRNLERLGMLAWAKGCVADYQAAEQLWHETLSLAKTISPGEALERLPFIAYTLVDCFSEAGELSRAQSVARQAWSLCGESGPLPPQGTFSDDSDWLLLWFHAKLDVREILPMLLARHAEKTDPRSQALTLSIREWVDDLDEVIAAWLGWVDARSAAGEWQLLENFRFAMLRGLRARNEWNKANQLADTIWQNLGKIETPEAQKARIPWDWERFNPFGAIEAKDWVKAQQIVQREIEERGVQEGGWAILVAAGSGTPFMPELVQAVEQNGVEGVADYGMFGWYLIARQAGTSGDTTAAFDALGKALSYWTNPPYVITIIFENDVCWGDLRQHPAFKRAFDERRQRIGPIHGSLHYFPNW